MEYIKATVENISWSNVSLKFVNKLERDEKSETSFISLEYNNIIHIPHTQFSEPTSIVSARAWHQMQCFIPNITVLVTNIQDCVRDLF